MHEFSQDFFSIFNKALFRHRRPCSELFGDGRSNNFGAPGQIEGSSFCFDVPKNVRRSAPTSRKLDEFENRGRKRKKMSFVSAFRLYVRLLAAKIKRPVRTGLLEIA